MKKTPFLLIVLAVITISVQAQDTLRLFSRQLHPQKQNTEQPQQQKREHNNSDIRTLTGPGRSLGFYMGLNTDFSHINSYQAGSVGGTVAFVANHGLAIGLTGKGFFSEPFDVNNGTTTRRNYTGGYGGLLIEPVLFPRFPVHVSFPIVLGAGGIARSIWYNYEHPYDEVQIEPESSAGFMIAEPGVQLEVNLARWLRIGVGASYRFTSDLVPLDLPNNILEGYTTSFSLKVGKF